MFIIDSIESESVWQDLLLHTEFPSVVDVGEDVDVTVVSVEEDVVDDDVGVSVEVDDEVSLHVILL